MRKDVVEPSAVIAEIQEKLAPIAAEMDDGWTWEYEPDTYFVGANHPMGGKRSVCEIPRTAGNRDALGQFFAAAPRLLRSVLDVLQQAQAENERLREARILERAQDLMPYFVGYADDPKSRLNGNEMAGDYRDLWRRVESFLRDVTAALSSPEERR